MQKYLNIDPTSEPGQENANLLNDGVGDDDTPSGSFSGANRTLPMQSFSSGSSHHAVNHTTHFGSGAGAGSGPGSGGISTSMHGTAGAGGYTPPAFGMGSAYAANESEDSVSNPLASPPTSSTSGGNAGARFPTPTRTAPVVAAPAPVASNAPSASSNKTKKAMKEPKSMRSST